MKQCNCSSLPFHYITYLSGTSLLKWSGRVVVSGTNSSWISVTSGQVQGPILLSILFNIFNTDVDYGAEYSLQQVGWWHKNWEEWQINHKDVLPSPRHGLTGKVNFSWGRNDPMHKYIPDVKQLESSLKEKTWGVLVDTVLTWASNISLWKNKLRVSWDAWGGIVAAGHRRWSFPSVQH